MKEKEYEQNEEYYESLDKRKTEYKDYAKWKKNFEQANTEGLGDKIEKITKATGIKKVVEWVSGEDCGCDKRKEILNKKLSFKILECPTEEMYNWMDNYFTNEISNKVPNHVQNEVNNILGHVHKRHFSRKNCCFGDRIQMLRKIYEAYKPPKDEEE